MTGTRKASSTRSHRTPVLTARGQIRCSTSACPTRGACRGLQDERDRARHAAFMAPSRRAAARKLDGSCAYSAGPPFRIRLAQVQESRAMPTAHGMASSRALSRACASRPGRVCKFSISRSRSHRGAYPHAAVSERRPCEREGLPRDSERFAVARRVDGITARALVPSPPATSRIGPASPSGHG